jgi:hypothetical protein
MCKITRIFLLHGQKIKILFVDPGSYITAFVIAEAINYFKF